MTRGSAHDADLAAGDSLTVAAVAALVGVAPSTLRTWARRYGLEPSGHRSGLHRRYSGLDVSRLQLMRSLTQAGLSSRDAAARAVAATPEQLALAGSVRPLGEAAGFTTFTDARPAPVAEPRVPDRSVVEGLDPAVRTLLATVGRGDARGAISLLRLAIRDLGAARTYDERLLPARAATWILPPDVQPRAEALLTSAACGAVGEGALRREPRNEVPVLVAALPGHDDPAAVQLALAALAERSLKAERLDLGRNDVDAGRRLDAVAGGVVAVFVAEGLVPGQLAARVRAASTANPIFWGEGWLHWPGHEASLADVVRTVESASTTDA